MIRRPARRLALATCAVLAAVGLSSCSTFSDNDAVARVEDVELTADDLQTIYGAALDYDAEQQTAALAPGDTTVITAAESVPGEQMRQFISQWIQYQAAAQLLEDEGLAVTDADLATARDQALAGIETDPPQVLIDYVVWQFAVEAKFGTRTSDTQLTDYASGLDIHVDPYYGAWNPDSGTVEALGAAG